MTSVWTENYTAPSSQQQSQVPEPRRSAPPIMQQTSSAVAQPVDEEVIWDDSMMDLEDEPLQSTQPVAQSNAVASQATTETSSIDSSGLRLEAIHVRGVDNLSTDDMKLYLASVCPDIAFSKLEWIDDTSLNVVYDFDDMAATALETLTAERIELVPVATLRLAKSLHGDKVIDGLKVRIAFLSDVKERGARDRSRWYLFNPRPTEGHDGRYFSCEPGVDAARRDSRRRDRRYDPYSRRGRSRSRSPQLSYDEPPNNEAIELFPEKVTNGARLDQPREISASRSPPRRRRIEHSHPTFSSIARDLEYADQSARPSGRMDVVVDDLFPEKVGNRSGPVMDATPPPALANRIQAQVDLFPENPPHEASVELFPEKVHSSLELFPEKVGVVQGEGITSKSLAERIRDSEGDPSNRELFPELARRNDRRRRRKAEDHF